MRTEQAIQKCRERWLKAKVENNEKQMILWEKMGKLLKKFVEKNFNGVK